MWNLAILTSYKKFHCIGLNSDKGEYLTITIMIEALGEIY